MSDPIIETPPPIEVEVVTGAATPLSADTPEDLGTAAAGVGIEASRSDHVHAMPTAAEVGADPAGAANAVAGDLSTHESLTTTAHGGIVGDTDARLTDARTPLAHTHAQSDVTGLVADMAAKVDMSLLAQPSGVATLGADSKVPASQLPAANSIWIDWNNLVYGGGATPGGDLFASGGSGNISGRAWTVARSAHAASVIPDDWPGVDVYLWWGHTDPNPAATAAVGGEVGVTNPGGSAGRSSIGTIYIAVGAPHVLNRTLMYPAVPSPGGPGAWFSWFMSIANTGGGGGAAMTKPFIVVGVELRKAGA